MLFAKRLNVKYNIFLFCYFMILELASMKIRISMKKSYQEMLL